MMQHVAIAKSEVAAFATGSQPNSFTGSESNEQFGKLLQDQKSVHSKADESAAPPPHSPKKQASQQSIDETKTHPSAAEGKDIKEKSKSTSNEATDPLTTQTSSSANENTAIESNVEGDESASIVAQDWVALIDNLQKMDDFVWPTKQPLVDVEAKLLDVSVTDSTLLNKVEKGLLEQVSELQTIDKVNVTPDKLALQQALEKLTEEAKVAQVLSSDPQQKTVELLLEQPAVLQDLFNKMQMDSQKSGTATAEQKSLDTTTDNVISKNPLLADQQIATDEQVDLSLAENKALLSTLLVDSGKTEKVVNNNDIKSILNLTDNKLDKVLENIAQRVFDSKKTGEALSPEQIAQQAVVPRAADIISSVESSSKDFIAALKSGLEEFKNQLSKGREPGIDLKALVSDALTKTTDSEAVAKASVNLDQTIKSVSQVLDFVQTMSRTIDHDQTYNVTLRDVAQIQGEQSKQIQLNQFESKFEKAINIAKPEGHQQLAEKVRWMVNTQNLVAEIRLDPAELGSVHVKVAMSGESATVNFVVQSQQARDAVDNATSKLREMLAEKGIELGQSSVREESNGQQGQGDGELANQGADSKVEAEDINGPEQVLAQQNIVNGAIGGIDYFV
jgi:flagellar hook-length control protein FliK